MGAYLDTGAQKSVIGKEQAKMYCLLTEKPFTLKGGGTTFRFGARVYHSLGELDLELPMLSTHQGRHIVNVLDADVPLLLGLDWLDDNLLSVKNVNDTLVSNFPPVDTSANA